MTCSVYNLATLSRWTGSRGRGSWRSRYELREPASSSRLRVRSSAFATRPTCWSRPCTLCALRWAMRGARTTWEIIVSVTFIIHALLGIVMFCDTRQVGTARLIGVYTRRLGGTPTRNNRFGVDSHSQWWTYCLPGTQTNCLDYDHRLITLTVCTRCKYPPSCGYECTLKTPKHMSCERYVFAGTFLYNW